MSQTPPARPAPTPRDPLRAFRERAAVILAKERGLTPQCRIKLTRVARELGLSEAQAEEGIRMLRRSGSSATTDPLVEKLRQRLRKDLAGRQKTVIGPEIESRVIDSATRKYGLDAAVIREVLTEVAAELGLRHITGDQAVQLFADVVDQAVGDATWVAREAWDRLRSSGEKWGLSFEEADDLIQQKIAANRRSRAAGRFWSRFVVGSSLAGVALAAVVLGVMYYQNQERSTVAQSDETDSAATSKDEIQKPPSQPAWWDVDLAVAMSTARREISDVAEIYDDLRSEEGSVRQKAYGTLVDLAAAMDAGLVQREMVVDLLAGCHALDPDEACAETLRRGLLGLVPDARRELTRSTALYERAYFGVETAMTLLARQGMPTARADALAAAISSAVGVRVAAGSQEADDSLKSALAALTRTLYRHLTAQGPAQPEQAAGLQAYLTAQASVRLPPEDVDRLNAAFLVAMLTGAEQAWKSFEPLLVQLSQSRDPLVVLDLLSAYRQIKNRELQQTLGALLVRRTGAKPRGDDPRQVARAVRQALGAAGLSIAHSAEDRWEDLQAAAEPVLGRRSTAAGNREAVLAETIEMASLATAALALAEGEPGFAIFDELTRAADAVPAEVDSASGENKSKATEGFRPPPVRKRAMSQHDRQVLARSIAQLADFEQQPPVARSNALRIVAARVPMAQDLSYEQATIVARYLLAAKEDDELESALGAIEQLRSWKQVRLAVADQLQQSRLKPRQLQTVLEGLMGSLDVAGEDSPAALRVHVLRSVLADLESPAQQHIDPAEGLQAMRQLAEPYRARARVLAVPAHEYQEAASPAAVLEIVVRRFAKGEATTKTSPAAENRPLVHHELEAVDYLADSDAQRTVLLQRLLIDGLAQRIAIQKPKAQAAAWQIKAALAASDAVEKDLLLQLRSGERATLEMGMLYAQP